MFAEMWPWKKIAIFCAPLVLVLFGLVAWMLLRKTIRTRFRMRKQLREDPDINEWLVVFSWSRKILYGPTIVYSMLAAILSWTNVGDPLAIGGIGALGYGMALLAHIVEEIREGVPLRIIPDALGAHYDGPAERHLPPDRRRDRK